MFGNASSSGRDLACDHAAGRGRAILRGDDAEIIARRGASVGAAIALERRALSFGHEIRRMGVGTERIVPLEVAHDAVVRVDVRAGRHVVGRKADDLIVLAQRLALPDRARQDLVAGRDARRGRNLALDSGVGQDVHAGHDDIVVRVQAEGDRSGHVLILPMPRASHGCRRWRRKACGTRLRSMSAAAPAYGSRRPDRCGDGRPAPSPPPSPRRAARRRSWR